MYRLAELRRSGTPLLLRPVPAAEDHGWHHGSAHYGDDTLVYHRLVTFWRAPAVRLIRSAIGGGATGAARHRSGRSSMGWSSSNSDRVPTQRAVLMSWA